MSANATQVGGTHYNNAGYPHWDLAADLQLGYFEGQITKYITRHREKKGLEDVLKAQHFTLKLIELARGGKRPMHRYPTTEAMADYRDHNKLDPTQMQCILDAVTWQFVADLYRVMSGIEDILRCDYGVDPTAATDGSAATTGYTNQDR